MHIFCNYKINYFEEAVHILLVITMFIAAVRPDFMSTIFIYFTTTTYYTLSGVLRISGAAPYLLLLLLSRGILVFLLFCSLLYNNKIYFDAVYLVLSWVVPAYMCISLGPVAVPFIRFTFNFNPAQLLTVPSAMLFIISARNLLVTFRN